MAELILDGFEPWIKPESIHHLLDLGTGSGCIGIACAKVLPQAQVCLSDVSEPALALARSNIEMHQLQARVQLIQSDLFSGFDQQRFDVIISNPPYVSEQEWRELPKEYHREPKLGLTAPHYGLGLVLNLLIQAPYYLNDNGHLIVEVGYSDATLMALCPSVDFTWLEFEYGGQGVFLLSKQECLQHVHAFEKALETTIGFLEH